MAIQYALVVAWDEKPLQFDILAFILCGYQLHRLSSTHLTTADKLINNSQKISLQIKSNNYNKIFTTANYNTMREINVDMPLSGLKD